MTDAISIIPSLVALLVACLAYDVARRWLRAREDATALMRRVLAVEGRCELNRSRIDTLSESVLEVRESIASLSPDRAALDELRAADAQHRAQLDDVIAKLAVDWRGKFLALEGQWKNLERNVMSQTAGQLAQLAESTPRGFNR